MSESQRWSDAVDELIDIVEQKDRRIAELEKWPALLSDGGWINAGDTPEEGIESLRVLIASPKNTAELEAVIKLQKGAIAAKDKFSRRQIKKHTALVNRLNLLTAQVQEMADDEWPDDAKINSGWLLDELALLGKEIGE